jgi:hypothetical protein
VESARAGKGYQDLYSAHYWKTVENLKEKGLK